MILSGKFTMISIVINDREGKKYYNVNIEAEDGKLLQVGSDEKTVSKLKKYQKHDGWFDVGSYNQKMYMRLVDAAPILGK